MSNHRQNAGKQRRYPGPYDRLIPIVLALLVVAIVAVVAIAAAVALGLFPAGH